ncbi:uncharacterized protein MELLADRAFT_110455 [Melampsora larici-populina 98AG31]|uniref:Uncharacterized protein n=1 Tax=Melampsora larici-populina (strain 98AG31 / pathotype 3-4-7) TaxID=747676 RepID=F4RZV4_MELLP|nr:uncharacterized protein MELLADRAFT_110455 [Melampsora larici-populina 98AG31]EGG02067.1 hypothetical protein MELLADRAFT_110455 [Melampsora larici-populina 98AG31]
MTPFKTWILGCGLPRVYPKFRWTNAAFMPRELSTSWPTSSLKSCTGNLDHVLSKTPHPNDSSSRCLPFHSSNAKNPRYSTGELQRLIISFLMAPNNAERPSLGNCRGIEFFEGEVHAPPVLARKLTQQINAAINISRTSSSVVCAAPPVSGTLLNPTEHRLLGFTPDPVGLLRFIAVDHRILVKPPINRNFHLASLPFIPIALSQKLHWGQKLQNLPLNLLHRRAASRQRLSTPHSLVDQNLGNIREPNSFYLHAVSSQIYDAAIKQRFQRKSFTSSSDAPEPEVGMEPSKNPTLLTNLKRALQSSPELVQNKLMSSTSTLSSRLSSPTRSSLESSQRSHSNFARIMDINSRTTVIFEPMRGRKQSNFPLRQASDMSFVRPLRQTRSLAECAVQSPNLLPTITITTPEDDERYVLFSPKSDEPDHCHLAVPTLGSRNWPHPAGPWLRASEDVNPLASKHSYRLSNDTLVRWPAGRNSPPRLMTDDQREAIALVEQINLNLEMAQTALYSRLQPPCLDEWAEEFDDDEYDDDEEELTTWSQQDNQCYHRFPAVVSDNEDYDIETIEMIE